MRLTDSFDDTLQYGEVTFHLTLTFDRVLKAYEVLANDVFDNVEKVFVLWQLFVRNYDEVSVTLEHKNYFVREIFKQHLESEEDAVKGDGEKPQFDLQKDAGYIYASFLYDYNIDLFEQHGKMHWKKFLALMNGLSDDSKFKEVIGIRGAKIPAPNKHNNEERDRIIKLKRIYALEGVARSNEDLEAEFSSVFDALKKSAKGGGK